MQTRDEVEGLHNCREFSQPLVLKELLKDKGIVFSLNAKKSELVEFFNAAHHTSGRPSCMKVRVPVATLPCTAAAYNGSIPKFKQFFFVNKQLPQEI